MPVEPNVRARRHTLPAAYPRIGRFAAQRATWWSTAGTSPLGRPDRVAGLTTPADYEQVTARGHTMLLDTRFGSPDDAAAPDRHDGSPRCAPSSSRAIPPSARSSSDDPTLPVPPCPRVFSPRQLVPAGAAWDFRHHTDQGATMNRRRRGRSSEHRSQHGGHRLRSPGISPRDHPSRRNGTGTPRPVQVRRGPGVLPGPAQRHRQCPRHRVQPRTDRTARGPHPALGRRAAGPGRGPSSPSAATLRAPFGSGKPHPISTPSRSPAQPIRVGDDHWGRTDPARHNYTVKRAADPDNTPTWQAPHS
jgi:hypothetical protein